MGDLSDMKNMRDNFLIAIPSMLELDSEPSSSCYHEVVISIIVQIFSCLAVAVFGAFGNLFTLLAIPLAQYKKKFGLHEHPRRKSHKHFG